MHGVRGVEEDGGAAGAGEGGGDLLADGGVLADAGDDDFAALLQAFEDQVDSLGELLAETVADLLQAGDLGVDDVLGAFDVFHKATPFRRRRFFQGLEKKASLFPTLGKLRLDFSNVWKNRRDFLWEGERGKNTEGRTQKSEGRGAVIGD